VTQHLFSVKIPTQRAGLCNLPPIGELLDRCRHRIPTDGAKSSPQQMFSRSCLSDEFLAEFAGTERPSAKPIRDRRSQFTSPRAQRVGFYFHLKGAIGCGFPRAFAPFAILTARFLILKASARTSASESSPKKSFNTPRPSWKRSTRGLKKSSRKPIAWHLGPRWRAQPKASSWPI
jgi:hypothetical protein